MLVSHFCKNIKEFGVKGKQTKNMKDLPAPPTPTKLNPIWGAMFRFFCIFGSLQSKNSLKIHKSC